MPLQQLVLATRAGRFRSSRILSGSICIAKAVRRRFRLAVASTIALGHDSHRFRWMVRSVLCMPVFPDMQPVDLDALQWRQRHNLRGVQSLTVADAANQGNVDLQAYEEPPSRSTPAWAFQAGEHSQIPRHRS
jgi:hypothetical protein